LHRGEAAEAFWSHNIFKVGEGYIGGVAQTKTPSLCTDLGKDERFVREAVAKAGFKQMVCLPMLSGVTLMGVLSVATRHLDPFEERSIDMLSAVCKSAGLAIENARLHNNARKLAVLEERNRIGMDLHDGIIQSIYAVGLSLESAQLGIEEDSQAAKERIQNSITGLNQVIRDIRSYILDLRPRQLGSEGLMNGLKRLTTEFRANTFADTHIKGPDTDLSEMPQSHAMALFHICQEALANAAKHAKAKNVQINVWTTADRVLMELQDNGKGFDLDNMRMNIGHGLNNMQARARNVGGDVEISSSPEQGTTILAWVPRFVSQTTGS
jgi:signal transduction histidine kinase